MVGAKVRISERKDKKKQKKLLLFRAFPNGSTLFKGTSFKRIGTHTRTCICDEGIMEQKKGASSIMKQVGNIDAGSPAFLQSVFLGIAGARAAITRRGDVEAVAQGERDEARVVVVGLAENHVVEVERAQPLALVEEIVAR